MFENMDTTLKGLNIDDVYADKVNLVINYIDGSSSNTSLNGFSVKKYVIEDLRKNSRYFSIRSHAIKNIISNEYEEISLELANQICLDVIEEIENSNKEIDKEYTTKFIIDTFKEFSINLTQEIAFKIYDFLFLQMRNVPFIKRFEQIGMDIKSLLNENDINLSLEDVEEICSLLSGEFFDEYCENNKIDYNTIFIMDYSAVGDIPWNQLIKINVDIFKKYGIDISNIKQELIKEMWCYISYENNNYISNIDIYTTKNIEFKRNYILFLNYLQNNPVYVIEKLANNYSSSDKGDFSTVPETNYLQNKFFDLAINLDHIKNCHGLGVLEEASTSDIKEVLKKNGLEVGGRKKTLINRVKENLTIDIINKEFPGDAYGLTEKGKEFLDEFDYYLYYIDNVISFKEYIEICELNPELSTFDILITIYDNLIRKYIEINANCPDDLYNLLLHKSYVYKNFNDKLNELKLLLLMYVRINGKTENIHKLKIRNQDLHKIKTLSRKLNLSDDEINNLYDSVNDCINEYNIPKISHYGKMNLDEESLETINVYEKDYVKLLY